MRGVVVLVVCFGLLVACSDSSSPTDPGSEDPNGEDPIEDPIEDPDNDPDEDPDEEPDPIDVAGTWSYEALELEGSGATCTIDEATVELTEDGETVTGQANGRLTCETGDQDWAWDRNADVEDVALDGSDVTFVFSDLNSEAERADVVHEGTIDGDTMSGTATLYYDDFELTGEWTATRED